MPDNAEPRRVEPWLTVTDTCDCKVVCVEPATPVVMLPPAAVVGDVVVFCVLVVTDTMLAVQATTAGVLTVVVDILSVMRRDGVEDTKLLGTVEPTVVGVVIVF